VTEACTFCGGRNVATTSTHVPHGTLFSSGILLDGYEFAACEPCSVATRIEEDVVTVLAQLRQVTATAEQLEQIKRRSALMKKYYPAIHAEMEPSIRERREAIKRFNLQPPPGGTVLDIPLFQVNGPLVNTAVANFARTLFCALHRMHTGEVLSAGGGIECRWFPTLQVGELPPSLASLFLQFPKVTRVETVVGEEFFYRWGASSEKRLEGYLTFMHGSFAMLGMVHEDAEPVIAAEQSRVLRPFDWTVEKPTPRENVLNSDAFRAEYAATN
jgi:hypothetical protein